MSNTISPTETSSPRKRSSTIITLAASPSRAILSTASQAFSTLLVTITPLPSATNPAALITKAVKEALKRKHELKSILRTNSDRKIQNAHSLMKVLAALGSVNDFH